MNRGEQDFGEGEEIEEFAKKYKLGDFSEYQVKMRRQFEYDIERIHHHLSMRNYYVCTKKKDFIMTC
ncbi:hypothetical protein [Vagococcus allomyrinae]|uniref:hypothetical protein n=1 Tax=Vagococcus allomyrinae TaxID=2794353 RepID=UPI001FD74611|nr:hypothetical protein [Vagococcus allomyrinae]